MKKLLIAALLFSCAAFASPQWGILQIQDDGSGTNNNGYYFVPADHTGQYIWLYDGQQGNPMRFAAIGAGFGWDGTTLTAAPAARSFNHTTRSLNSCFQLSTTRDAQVRYSVEVQTTMSLTGGQQGTVYLRTYTNSGCSTGTQEVTRFTNGQTGTLTIGLSLTNTITGSLSGIVPAGTWAQLVTENNTSTPTFTARPGQEVLL